MFIKQFKIWIDRHFLLMLSVPLIILSIIYINYGEIFGAFLTKHPDLYKLFQLQTQISVFSSDIKIPEHIKYLGYDTIIFLYLFFYCYFATYCYNTLYLLAHHKGSKGMMIIECVIFLIVYKIIVSPHLAFWFVFFGYFIASLIILIIFLYWIYAIRMFNEEK